jgi:cell division protein FtsX
VQLRIKDMQRAPEMTQALAQPGALPLDNEATLDVCNRLNESMIQTAQQAIQMLLKEAVSANPARLAELSAIQHESTARRTALSAVDPANPAEGLRLCEGIKGFRPVPYMLSDWTQQNKTWFSAVKLEKRMMFIILALIIAVAAFNLVSSLVMTVTNKQADIAILRTLGAQPGSIMLIFLVQGMTIGLIGTVTGVALGSLIAWSIPWTVPFLERLFHHQFLPPSVYFITELPSELVAMDVLRIGVMSFILSALATLYPSWRASTVRPAEALRYE